MQQSARPNMPAPRRTRTRVLAVLPLVLVISYAALLRLDAITQQYGAVASPAWLHGLQVHSRASMHWIEPAGMAWSPERMHPHRNGPPTQYYGDPYNYLGLGRAMTSFYAAEWREPMFPFVTKIFLALLGNQDVAVSFASATFSVVMVFLTWLIGSHAFSRWVGLGAALALAIERDAISCGILGGRDEVFTCAVLLFAYVLLRYVREPSRRLAVVAGICAGGACLVRITSPSFVLPGFACLLFATARPWRARLSDLVYGVLMLGLVAGPYVFNCWRVLGDPLYAINSPAGVYEAAEGQGARPTAAGYVGAKALDRPFRLLDTVALGMTAYPFENKWRGFVVWSPALGQWLSRAALVGLFIWLGSTPGRVLLIILVTSLVPYSVTWQLSSEWRLTEVAYPFFLLAAGAAVAWGVTWAAPSRLRGLLTRPPRLRPFVLWGLAAGGVGLGVWLITRTLPVQTMREALRENEDVTIMAGGRDGAFFGAGWSAPLAAGAVTTRATRGLSSIVWLPLPIAQDYGATLRMDPASDPLDQTASLAVVRVFLNGSPVAHVTLRWTPGRVGAYDFQIPRRLVLPGTNRLELMADNGGGRFWYIRLRPPAR